MFSFLKKTFLITILIILVGGGIFFFSRSSTSRNPTPPFQKDWSNISGWFADNPQLIKEWTNHGFTYEQTKDWIDVGLAPDESELVNWLVKEKGGNYANSEWILNYGNITELKKQYWQGKWRIYQTLKITHQEPEYKTYPNPTLPISSVGTNYQELERGHLPAGSALITDTLDGSNRGESELSNKGIDFIIHACPQPRSLFNDDQDFINCVVKSVQNSIILADQQRLDQLAIPLIGGGIFLGSCNPKKLAEGIVTGARRQLTHCQTLDKIIFVDFASPYFQLALDRSNQVTDYFGPPKTLAVARGDIRDKNLHGASAIVNAANTQVKFGSGISGKIAEQVGDKEGIDKKTQQLIKEFQQAIPTE